MDCVLTCVLASLFTCVLAPSTSYTGSFVSVADSPAPAAPPKILCKRTFGPTGFLLSDCIDAQDSVGLHAARVLVSVLFVREKQRDSQCFWNANSYKVDLRVTDSKLASGVLNLVDLVCLVQGFVAGNERFQIVQPTILSDRFTVRGRLRSQALDS